MFFFWLLTHVGSKVVVSGMFSFHFEIVPSLYIHVLFILTNISLDIYVDVVK